MLVTVCNGPRDKGTLGLPHRLRTCMCITQDVVFLIVCFINIYLSLD